MGRHPHLIAEMGYFFEFRFYFAGAYFTRFDFPVSKHSMAGYFFFLFSTAVCIVVLVVNHRLAGGSGFGRSVLTAGRLVSARSSSGSVVAERASAVFTHSSCYSTYF